MLKAMDFNFIHAKISLETAISESEPRIFVIFWSSSYFMD